MKTEIRRLRESIADGGGTGASTSGDAKRGRRRRGGRGGSDRGREAPEKNGDRERRQDRRSLPKEPPEDAPVGLLVDHLRERGVTVFEGSDDLNRNEAFEHLARHLGTHFELLQPFYERMKRTVATGRGSRIDIEHFSPKERSAAVQFGTLLHRHGMLKDFYYHRSPKKSCRVIPTKDGTIGQFLTGGWLEIFVSLVLARRLKSNVSPAKYQMLYNVKGRLPDGREFEADLMAYVDGRLFWLECKTGNWQDYSARFKGLVDTFGVDRESAGLLLIRPPDESTRSRATDMLNMTLLSLSDVDDFISQFLGVESESDPSVGESDEDEAFDEAARESAAGEAGSTESGEGATSGVRDGEGDNDQERARRRRRRRRRGGRGRGRRGGARRSEAKEGEEASPAAASADGASDAGVASDESGEERERQKSLHEPVPIQPLDAEEESGAGANGQDQEAGAETEPRPARSARPSPFTGQESESAVSAGDAKPAKRESKPAKRESKPAAEKKQAAEKKPAADREPAEAGDGKPAKAEPKAAPKAEPKASPKGVTIQPDLAAMMAGVPKKKDED